MENYPHGGGYCFAAFVANTWNTPAHITVEYQGAALPVDQFARIPVGPGPTFKPFDPSAGIPPGEVAILFLSGPHIKTESNPVLCPIKSAITTGVNFNYSGIGDSFHIQSDVPVAAYQINPYGGGSAATTGASLLLPTSVWDTNYVAVNAGHTGWNPSMSIIAMDDETEVVLVPATNVDGGKGIPSGPAHMPLSFKLNKGQHAQISQGPELTGSVVNASKPVGLMGGHQCMNVPADVGYCDHGEQMIPPVRALGHEYVGVMHRRRVPGDRALWQLVGTVDSTMLTWSKSVGGPPMLDRGQAVEFYSDEPFVVTSQDADHPFLLFEYMTGGGMAGYGDPDFVLNVSPKQYLRQYVFFADPTYPETNLVLVRTRTEGEFADVYLDCAGVITGWEPVGEYEWTRVDLTTGDFQNVGLCSAGWHQIRSAQPFGVWVWGWGTPLTSTFTMSVSYGYPGGMGVQAINDIVIQPK